MTQKPRNGSASVDAIQNNQEITKQREMILKLLPQFAELSNALGELFELFEAHEVDLDFDSFCRSEFGIEPDQIREAAARLPGAR